MIRLREAVAAFLVVSLCLTPVFADPASALGTVVFSDRAHLGAALASVGTTVYGGDKLSTEKTGSVQVRAGAARLLLTSSSVATLGQEDGVSSAALSSGSATFSTANSRAFAVRAAGAVVRPQGDGPTVGQVTYVNPKELVVKSTRGDLTITVDEETAVIPEGRAFRVLIDPTPEARAAAEPQGPRGAGTKGPNGPPRKAGRNRFLLVAIVFTSAASFLAVRQALLSPDRP